MTTHADVLAHLRTIARVTAVGIADGAFDAFDLAKLRSDDGLVVGGVVVWHRVADDVVVTWAGNDADYNMDWSVLEFPVPRGL